MIELAKKVLRFAIMPLYLLLFFLGVFEQGYGGLAVSFVLLYAGMWAFVRRKLKAANYIISAGLLLFYFLAFWTQVFDVASSKLALPDKWSVYGALYSAMVIVFGVRFILRNRRSRYQVARTICLMGVQLVLAFVMPFVFRVMIDMPYFLSYLWPLKIEYFYPQVILEFPYPFVIYSLVASLVLAPILALVFGKRFYCSWVCGCGGLAETFGDRWRHLSDKSAAAWKFEKVSIYSMLAIAVLGTLLVVLSWRVNAQSSAQMTFLKFLSEKFMSSYGYLGSTILAGVAGVGFYPTLGSRVWCRFFCPMAALLGLVQKVGRFHIRVKKDMCISCGNCSTFCEMGIDVRSYAQANSSFTRAGCVGCGLCAHVCPRGVLRLQSRKARGTVV